MDTSKKRKLIIAGIVILVLVVAATLIIGITLSRKSGNDASPLAKAMQIGKRDEADVLTVLKDCGVGDIVTAAAYKFGDEQNIYALSDSETAKYADSDRQIYVYLDNKTKKVVSVTYADTPLYQDGEVVGNVRDCYVSGEAREKYKADAQLRVNQLLAYPDTAAFPDDDGWHFTVADGQDVCRATVTSSNTFGERVNMDFEIKYDRSSGDAASFVLDGTEYIVK